MNLQRDDDNLRKRQQQQLLHSPLDYENRSTSNTIVITTTNTTIVPLSSSSYNKTMKSKKKNKPKNIIIVMVLIIVVVFATIGIGRIEKLIMFPGIISDDDTNTNASNNNNNNNNMGISGSSSSSSSSSSNSDSTMHHKSRNSSSIDSLPTMSDKTNRQKNNNTATNEDNDGNALTIITRLLNQYRPEYAIKRFWACSSTTTTAAAATTTPTTTTTTTTTNNTMNDYRSKLIFVHIFKTAGSSFRMFLFGYAKLCHRKSVTLLCTDIDADTLDPDPNTARIIGTSTTKNHKKHSYWKATNGKDCKIKNYIDGRRSSTYYKTTTMLGEHNKINYDVLRETNLDILGGHLPLGLHENWFVNKQRYYDDDSSSSSSSSSAISHTTNNNDNSSNPNTNNNEFFPVPVQPLYITFFRNPIEKYVSKKVYSNKKTYTQLSFQQVVEEIKLAINATKHYDGYTQYLLTPKQKQQKSIIHTSTTNHNNTKSGKKNRTTITTDEKVRMVQMNLVRYPVVIGIIERMTDSLDLIRYTINGDNNPQINRLLNALDTMKTPTSLIRNRSELSTSDIVRELQKDEMIFKKMQHMLRYEFQIYNFAMELHKRQVQYINS